MLGYNKGRGKVERKLVEGGEGVRSKGRFKLRCEGG